MNRLLLTSTLFLILVLVSSCLTQPEITIDTNGVPFITTLEDTTISLTHITEEELINKFGHTGNIFAEYPGIIPAKESIVFKFDIQTEQTQLNLDIRNIVLKIGERSSRSKYRDQLLYEWRSYLKRTADKENAESYTKDYMFKDKIIITPENPASGLIVFLDKFPKYGESYMRIGFKDENSDFQEVQIELDPLFMDTTEK